MYLGSTSQGRFEFVEMVLSSPFSIKFKKDSPENHHETRNADDILQCIDAW